MKRSVCTQTSLFNIFNILSFIYLFIYLFIHFFYAVPNAFLLARIRETSATGYPCS